MVSIIGVSATKQGRRIGSVHDLTLSAARGALADAQVEASGVRAIIVANALAGAINSQGNVRGQVWLSDLGHDATPIFNVDASCSSASAALFLAAQLAQTLDGPVLAVGAEQMIVEDRAATIEAIEHGMDPESRVIAEEFAAGIGTPVMAINAEWARQIIDMHDGDEEGVSIAAAKAYRLAAANPIVARPITPSPAEIAASPVINAPLRRLMCSSLSDGGAAAVVVPDGHPAAGHIRIRGHAYTSGDGSIDYHDRMRLTLEELWEQTGLDGSEVDLVELHDANAAEEAWAAEIAHAVAEGDGFNAVRRGDTLPGGAGVAVNPSGGLIGRGHPIGATGLLQAYEIVTQLRGQAGERQVPDAKLGMAVNTGGIKARDALSASAIMIERVR